MSVLGLQIRYRPVRIGWYVRYGNMVDVRRGLRLTDTFWGGRYNPIIPISTDVDAASLLRNYNVEAQYPLADSPEVTAFAESSVSSTKQYGGEGGSRFKGPSTPSVSYRFYVPEDAINATVAGKHRSISLDEIYGPALNDSRICSCEIRPLCLLPDRVRTVPPYAEESAQEP
jgi:hypothetical protein